MNLQKWLSSGEIQTVVKTDKSLSDLLKLIDRDLRDSQILELSADRRFATAYNAALNLANYVIREHGYRVAGKIGHHKITFDVSAEILGKASLKFMDFFDLCRRKRNKVDYDVADIVSDQEVLELIKMVRDFQKFVLKSSRA